MGQSIQAWKSGTGERLWLSMLIDALEQTARPELRSTACDGVGLARFRAQLALPASVHFASSFSKRN